MKRSLMKKLLLASIITLFIGSQAYAAIKGGDLAPHFEAQASLAGKQFNFSLLEELKKGPVVVYFYPSAYTGGCNIQAHTFAVEREKFAAAGATVIGVSLDSIDRLNKFSADPEYCAGKVAVAADVDGKIAKLYDLTVKASVEGKKDTKGEAITHGFAERSTFIIKQNGIIAETISGLKPAENVAKALKGVQNLAAAKQQNH